MGRTQLKVRIDEELKDEWQQAIDTSMSKRIEELVANDLAQNENVQPGNDEHDERDLPQNELQREAYLALWDHADLNNRIEKGHAETIVAERARVKKQLVRKAVLDPLEDLGFIRYQWGAIKIMPPKSSRRFGGDE